jgi:hypothetical protein
MSDCILAAMDEINDNDNDKGYHIKLPSPAKKSLLCTAVDLK